MTDRIISPNALSHNDTEATYNLSPLQQGMLFHTLRDQGVGMYISQAVSRHEHLDLEAFREAWQFMLDRHSILRTSFHWDDPEHPVQHVHASVRIPFDVLDWRGSSPGDQHARLQRLMREEREKGFNLNSAPMLRITAIQVSHTRWLCVNTHHHIILDGWSGSILAKEWGRLYESMRRGQKASLPPPRPFRDYIRWIEQQDLHEAEAFWRRHLKGVHVPTPLPSERERLPGKRVRMNVESWPITFTEEVIADIEQLAKTCRVTMNTVILAAWALLLSRYSDQPSVLFGLLVSGRPPALKGVESMVGMFLNTVPYRVTVNKDQALNDWLKELHLEQLDLQSYEYSPLMHVQRWSEMPPGMPLFRSMVARKDVTQSGSVSSDARSRTSPGKTEQSVFQQNYPMLLNITASKGLELKITYDARRFESGDMAWMMKQLHHLVVDMAGDPSRPVGAYALLSPDEALRAQASWNPPPSEIPSGLCLHHLVEQAARDRPHQEALVDSGRALSFEQVNRQANVWAQYWLDQGVGSGDVLGLYLNRSSDSVIALLAALKIGACALPLDPRRADENILTSGACPALNRVITRTDLKHRLPERMAPVDCVDAPSFSSSMGRTSDPHVRVTPDQAAVRIAAYSSDDSFRLFDFSHASVVHRVLAPVAPWEPDESFGTRSPLSSLDFVWCLFTGWSAGAAVHFLSDEPLDDAGGFLEEVEQAGITRLHAGTGLLEACLANEEAPKRSARVKHWYCTGDVLTPEIGHRFGQRFPAATLTSFYRLFEIQTALQWEVAPDSLGQGVLLGTPVANTRAYVLDEELRPCGVGEPGQLYLAGACLPMDGTGHDGEGAGRCMPDPFTGQEHARMAPTGDLVRRWADGRIEYLCALNERPCEQDGGPNTAIRVQRALQRHPKVRQAVVLRRQDERIAFVATESGATDLADVHGALIRLFSPRDCPTRYVFVRRLPLDRDDRTDRRALMELEDPGLTAYEIERPMQHPRTELEKTIADVWANVLHLDAISIDDNFFELGGHSLSATKATARLTRLLRSDIPLKAIFEAPTIARLAEWIQSEKHQEELPYSIQVTERGREAPLTFTQQQLWVLGQLHPNLPTYTIPSNTLFNGHMDIGALQSALRELTVRHEILRTTFVLRGGTPVQVINPPPDEVPIERIDVSDLPEEERMTQARWHGAQLGKKPWDLERGPMIRPQLVKLSDEQYVLNTMFHHIIADGPSMAVFCAELSRIYDAHAKAKPVHLPPPPLQFADFAIWERENIKGDLFQRQLRYWKQRLDGATLLEIPTDYPRPAAHGFFGRKVKFEIDRDTIAKIRKLGTQEGATLFMCLMTVYQLLLHRYSGLEDVLVGTAMTNRIRVELEKLIGLFVNTIPIRTDFSGDPTFRDLLRRTRDACREAFANMDLPFEETIAAIQPHRDLSRQGSPIFQFMLIHNPAGRDRRDADKTPGFRPGDPHNDTGHANFDVLLSTSETRGGLVRITLVYDTELFRPETIDRMISHLLLLFKEAVTEPDRRISALQLMDVEERWDVLERWSGESRMAEAQGVHTWIAEHARTQPDHPSLVFENRSLNYRELDKRANQVAAYLRARGVGPEVMVGLCVDRSPELIIGILGILKAGGAFVPMDPAYPEERLKHILRDTQCPLLLTDKSLPEALLDEDIRAVPVDIGDPAIDACSTGPVDSGVHGHHLAYVIYTSGSTGLPKGVMVEHRNLSSIIRAQIGPFGVRRESRVLQMLSMSFDAAIGEVFRALMGGATLYLARKDDVLPGPMLVDLLRRHRITAMALSPTALSAMPDAADTLPDLETITVGGEACSPQVAQRWGKGRRLLNAYGPTETTIGATLAADWDLAAKPPLGRPLDGVRVYALDKYRRPTPVGIPGELYIGGVGVTRGYLNNPSLTEEQYQPDPFAGVPGARMYRTGDLVRWLADGTLDFLGRVDEQVKIRGFRIELGEIETALAGHPHVSRCVVNVHEAKGVKRLAAYIVCEGGEIPSAGALRTFLKDRLPEYMVPAWFIPLPALPMNNSGKVDKKALPPPDLGELNTKVEYVAPVTDDQKQLAALWGEILGLERVGLNDNFFELGGDSISTIRVVARATEAGYRFTPRDMFQFQTLAELCAHAETAQGTPSQILALSE